MSEAMPCPQKSCASIEGLKGVLGDIQDSLSEVRGHLSGYEERFNGHMDAEEKLSARNAEALESLTAVVGKMQNEEQLDKVRKAAARKTAKRIITNIAFALTPVGAIVAFLWAATGAQITFGG